MKLSHAATAAMLSADGVGVEHRAERLPRARVLWVSPIERWSDPAFENIAGRSMQRYKEHLLQACAYELVPHDQGGVVCYADGYGGFGLEGNGGSGRAALVNGYYVKGIGRTSLLANGAEPSHASGGAYLEESVREAVLGELIAAEYPFSGVRTLAIIDACRDVTWPDDGGTERCVLAIRLPFVRPAHFARALNFRTELDKSGVHDKERVRKAFEVFEMQTGKHAAAWIPSLAQRLAHQSAYGRAHGLVHGSTTMSNMCIDGRLLDFGASSALLSHANPRLSPSPVEPGKGTCQGLLFLIEELLYYSQQYGGRAQVRLSDLDRIAEATRKAFDLRFGWEFLRRCGVSTAAIRQMRAAEWCEAQKAMQTAVDWYETKYEDYVENVPSRDERNALERVLDDNPPHHLRSLAQVLKSLTREDGLAVSRGRHRLEPRRRLVQAAIREKVQRLLEHGRDGRDPDEQQVNELIASLVCAGRRDTKLGNGDIDAVGFGFGDEGSYVVTVTDGGRYVAMPEFKDGRLQEDKDAEAERVEGAALRKLMERLPFSMLDAKAAEAVSQA